MTKIKIKKILFLNKKGLRNREIARRLNIHHRTVSYWLKKYGLSSSFANQSIKMISSSLAQCSKCNSIKSITEFQFGRRGQKYEYRFSYCNMCRKRQAYDSLNRSIEAFLKDRFNRLKVRCAQKGFKLKFSYKDLLKMYNNQEGKCFYTDVPMRWGVLQGCLRDKLSIDKIIPENGYVKNNVVLCTHKANTIKSDISLNEMKIWMPGWYKRVKKLLKLKD